MKIQQVNEHFAQKWENIALFYPHKTGILLISETSQETHTLQQVKIQQLPNTCWVFENEYHQLPNPTQKEQRNSFSSRGYKVEKTLLWQKDNELYVFMIEMKSELTLENMSSCIKKYEHSLNFFAPYLAAHPHFQSLPELYIKPVGVLCYNAEGDYSNIHTFKYGKTKPRFRKKYIEEKKRAFLMEVKPLVLEAKEMPVIFLQTPQNQDNNFSIDFSEIYQKLTHI